MAAIKYKVELTEAERSRLNEVSQRGKASVRTVNRLTRGFGTVSRCAVGQPRHGRQSAERYVEEGLEAAINDRPWPGRERKLDGRQEAHLPRAAQRPRSHALDTPLADQLEFAALETVRQAQKNELKPWQKKEWCIPKVSGEFVARMEDVLDLYRPEYNPERPVVCFDETSRQLTGEVVRRAAPGRVAL